MPLNTHSIRDGIHNCMLPSTDTEKDVANNPVLLYQREAQIARGQQRYRWLRFPDLGLPSGIDDHHETTAVKAHIPPEERFDLVKNLDFTGDAVKAIVALGIDTATTSLDRLRGYEDLATTTGTPDPEIYLTDRWASDVEFGRQMLNAVNPVVIRKITALPDNFPVTNEMVHGSLQSGTLEQQMKVS